MRRVHVPTDEPRVGRLVARAAPTDERDLCTVWTGKIKDWMMMSKREGGWMEKRTFVCGIERKERVEDGETSEGVKDEGGGRVEDVFGGHD